MIQVNTITQRHLSYDQMKDIDHLLTQNRIDADAFSVRLFEPSTNTWEVTAYDQGDYKDAINGSFLIEALHQLPITIKK